MFHESHSGETPLHLAVLNDQFKEADILLSHPELAIAKNRWGFTPLELAQFLGKTRWIEQLGGNLIKKVKIVLQHDQKISDLSPDDFKKATGVTYYPFLHFASYQFFLEVRKNCPFTLAKTFLGEENRFLGSAFQDKIFSGYTEDVVIRWIDEKIGYGLFANRDISEGSFVGEYSGVVRRLYRKKPETNDYSFHYPSRFWSWKYYVIDAQQQGNYMRYINHRDDPNLVPKCLVDRGILHHVFFASKKIHKGDQLTFDYGKDYWMHRQKDFIS